MKTIVRVGLGIAGLLVVLAIVAIVIVKTIDPNTLIAPIQAQVKAATGRDLAVRGGAHIALSLHPRIVLTDVVLSNAPWGRAKELARVERLELAASLLPLLSRRFEIEEIALYKPVVALETDGKGQKNWQSGASPSTSPGASGGGSLAGVVTIGNINVTDGVFTYQDGPKAAVSRLTVETLVVKPRALRSGVDVDFRGAFGDTPLALEGNVGSIETLIERKAPYPIDVKGKVAGQPFAVATRIKAEPARYTFDDLKLSLGANAVAGSLAVDTGGARPKVRFDLSAPALAMSAVPVPAIPAKQEAAPAKAPGRVYLVPDAPVSFAPLHIADADGKLAIGKLTLASGQSYSDVQVALTNADARLDVSRFSLGVFGGTLQGSLSVNASGTDVPALKLHLEGSGLSLGALLTAVGQSRDVRGGPTSLLLDLAMRGDSPHAWASTATGNVRVVVGRATLENTRIDPAAALDSLAAAVNPFRARDPSTELVCAVARFPVTNGIARVDRGLSARDGQARRVGVGHARLPRRDARPLDQSQGAQGHLDRSCDPRRPRARDGIVLLAPRGHRCRRIRKGDRKRGCRHRHRRPVRGRPGAPVLGRRVRPRSLPGGARRNLGAQRAGACRESPAAADPPRQRGRQGPGPALRPLIWIIEPAAPAALDCTS